MLLQIPGRRSTGLKARRRSFRPQLGNLEGRFLLSTVYFNDFESGSVGPGWSVAPTASPTPASPLQVSATPVGNRHFLGELANDDATLKVPNVGAGPVTVSFDLFILRTWDGNGPTPPTPGSPSFTGPDTFSLKIDGQPVLNTTFALAVDPAHPSLQSFGGLNAPQGSYPINTGSTEHGTLGYQGYPNQDPAYGSAVYRLTYTVPHATAGTLSVDFAGSHLETKDYYAGQPNETWGLDNVRVVSNSRGPDGGDDSGGGDDRDGDEGGDGGQGGDCGNGGDGEHRSNGGDGKDGKDCGHGSDGKGGSGQAQSIGFWQGPEGQSTINHFAGRVGTWLADEYPKLFGPGGVIIPNSGALSNSAIATAFKNFNSADAPKAEVATTALDAYAFGPTQFAVNGSASGILQPPFGKTLGGTYNTSDILTMLDQEVGSMPTLLSTSSNRMKLNALFHAINASHHNGD